MLNFTILLCMALVVSTFKFSIVEFDALAVESFALLTFYIIVK